MAAILPVPESEKRVLEILLRDLNETYPDKVIKNLGRDHKKWDEKVTRLYKNIGYENRNEFLAAYGFTVEQGKGGRPSGDLNAIVEELISRYEGDRFVTSVDQLKEENPDLAPKFKNIQNKAKELFGMSFNNYLKEKGVFQSNAAAEADRAATFKLKLDAVVEELKKRYEGKELPDSLSAIKDENADIAEIGSINAWTEKAYGKKALEFFVEQGLVMEKERKPEKTEEEIAAANFRKLPADQKLSIVTEELKKRVAADGERVHNIELLKEKYPDLPVQTIDAWSKKVCGKNANRYLVEAGIMKSIREVCIDSVKPVKSINIKKGILLEKHNMTIERKLLMENKIRAMDLIPPLGKDYYFVIDTDDKSPFGGGFWEHSQNKQLQKQLIDPSFKVKCISQTNLEELLSKKDEHKELFINEDRKAKCDRAMKLFKACVNKVEKYMDKTNDYNSPSATGSIRGRCVDSSASSNCAADFFDEAVKWLEECDSKGYDFDIDPCNLRKWYEGSFGGLIMKNSLSFDGEVGVRYPVGIAVAYLIYVDPKATIGIEFVRDKWELRGDYSSSKRVCLEIGDYGYDIDVHYNYYKAYDM